MLEISKVSEILKILAHARATTLSDMNFQIIVLMIYCTNVTRKEFSAQFSLQTKSDAIIPNLMKASFWSFDFFEGIASCCSNCLNPLQV